MDKIIYISVILPLKIEWEPCYSTETYLHKGDRVRVKFANKDYIGVVNKTDIIPDIDPEKIKKIISVESEMPPILPKEIELWEKVADYYMCTIGEVYKAAYPNIKINLEQSRCETKKRVCQRRATAITAITSRLEKLQARLDKKEIAISKSREGSKTRATLAEDIIRLNKAISLTQKALESAMEHLKSAENGLTIASCEEITDNVSLSDAQKTAKKQIIEEFESGKPVLLHGITGSGKTEIYISLALEVLKNRKNVLYLVPEIALSRQLEERLSMHFGERLITFHSQESSASKRNSAELIRNMNFGSGNYIALCTRSGLFLPHHDLGLIIVDEEHDKSYKQDSPSPRYNGRDTALLLSTIHDDCRIILGSATPSLEEIYNTRTGKHRLVYLNERFHGSAEPDVELIDTRAERRKRGMTGSFSRKLIDHIRETLKSGEQVLLLRSRRAWATAMQCDECGEIHKCPHCNVSMHFHKTESKMVCHYCGFNTYFTGKCIKCNGSLTPLGAGTQKLEEEVEALFPEARIARLDGDTVHSHQSIIKNFADGKTDILIGTQMISKGFDFGNLTLVAIISADSLLGMEDFRADENAHQLMEQFRGRCGRRSKKGKFIIQTSHPEHPIYTGISSPNGGDFYNRLLSERKDFGFPPFCRIIEISIKDRYEDRVSRMGYKLMDNLQPFSPVGPYAPTVDRIADQYIRKIRICLPKDALLTKTKIHIGKAISEFEKCFKYDGHITINVDPS